MTSAKRQQLPCLGSPNKNPMYIGKVQRAVEERGFPLSWFGLQLAKVSLKVILYRGCQCVTSILLPIGICVKEIYGGGYSRNEKATNTASPSFFRLLFIINKGSNELQIITVITLCVIALTCYGFCRQNFGRFKCVQDVKYNPSYHRLSCYSSDRSGLRSRNVGGSDCTAQIQTNGRGFGAGVVCNMFLLKK
jgi:hypothetical protein